MAVIVESPQEILLINISASIFLNDFVFIMSRSSLLFRRIIQQKHIGGRGGWGGGLEVVQILFRKVSVPSQSKSEGRGFVLRTLFCTSSPSSPLTGPLGNV